MKKYYAFVFLFLIAFCSSAQYEKHHKLENAIKKTVQFEAHNPTPINSIYQKKSSSSYGTSIGTTTYDLQSNYGLGNTRILSYPDGSITSIWTQSLDLNGGHPDRGTGYNIYDPNTQSWGAGETGQFGLSTLRTGWPQIVPLSSGELVLQHDFAQNVIVSGSRPTIGTGAWSSSTSVGFPGSWPRAVASGDTVHMVTVNNDGVTVINNIAIPMEYHRSDDGGQTWSISNYSNFPNYDNTVFWFDEIGADIYAIDANKNYVAIVVGGSWDPLVLYKSDNYGEDGSWTQTIISTPDSSYSFFDTLSGIHIVPTLSSEMSIVIDDNGLVHLSNTGYAVRWDSGQPKPQDGLGTRSYYPLLCAGIYYWNDTMSPVDFVYNDLVVDRTTLPGNVMSPISMFYDYTQDSVYNIPGDTDSIGVYNGGVAGHSSISIDNNGGIFIVWSQLAEMTAQIPGLGYYYRDIYFVHSFDGGATWSEAISVGLSEVGDDFISGGTIVEEDVFPSTVKRVGADDIIHMIFQSDNEAGLHVQGTVHPIVSNDMIYYPLDISPYRPVAIDKFDKKGDHISLYPNPSNEHVYINSENNNHFTEIRLFNTMGSEIQISSKFIDKNRCELDISNLRRGLYILKLNTGLDEITKTIIKE